MGFSAIAARELDLYAGRKEYLLLDVRSPEAYRTGHIRGARNLPLETLQSKMNTLPRNQIMVCYCERGGASLQAARELSRAGYEAISATGGIKAYRGKNLVKGIR